MLIDTHCHLDYPDFDGKRQAVAAAAEENGVSVLINPGTHLESSRAALKLGERFDAIFVGVGVHPTESETWTDASLEELRTLADSQKCIAIGEIGLDYYWNKTSPDNQKRLLQQQLDLASEKELPAILHNRESDNDLSDLICEWQRGLDQESALAERPGVLHSFSGSPDMAEKILAHNFFIGITGPVTFKKADQLRDIVKQTPLDKLLVETDSPFLSPEPYRGKQNQPAHVRYVADKIAEVKGMQPEEFYQHSTQNAQRLFAIEKTL
jgi:TatD DNase family protein